VDFKHFLDDAGRVFEKPVSTVCRQGSGAGALKHNKVQQDTLIQGIQQPEKSSQIKAGDCR
jgi:hypothetical protein